VAIEYRDVGSKVCVVLTACPVCGKEFPPNHGHERVMHFVNDHDAADF
jgi:hypothetical protein